MTLLIAAGGRGYYQGRGSPWVGTKRRDATNGSVKPRVAADHVPTLSS
jgi:hypothetical protein